MVGRGNEDAGHGGERKDAVVTEVDLTYAEETLARAIVVLGEVHAPDDDREDAARVIQALLSRACPGEAALADLLSALGRALHVELAVRRVLGEVQRLRPDALVERVARGVERLMAQAYEGGDHEALAELLLVALEEPRWLPRVRDEWGKAAVTWAVSRLPERYPLVLLVSGWVHAFGAVPDWMGELAEAHPDLVTSPRLPREVQWTLHRAAPTSAGWRSFASALGWTPTIESALFGGNLDVAVDTLEQAIGESTEESARLRLRLWLRELTGTTP